MERFEFDDVQLTYELRGRGEPIVLAHARAFVRWYLPLVDQMESVAMLRYRRRLSPVGGGGPRALTVADDARILARLMDHVGWRVAHLVGHSYGALVALQLAMDAPERAGSVALLEPAARGVSSAPQIVAALQPIIAAYRSGDTAGALDGFLRHVCGDGYRAELDRRIPGAYDEALGEADLFFQVEIPAVAHWQFGPAEAERVTQPVLNLSGADTVPRFKDGADLVQSWFPGAERATVPHAGHLLMVQNPGAVAERLHAFVSRHPLGEVGPPGPVGQAVDARRSSAAIRRASGV